MIVVQQISVHWGKESRGGRAAQRRNAVPEAFSLPEIAPVTDRFKLVHDTVYAWWDNNSKHKLSVEDFVPHKTFYIGGLRIKPTEDIVSVTYSYALNCGAPVRTSIPRKVLSLTSGTWGRIIYNGRFSNNWTGSWTYEKNVFNIGYFDTPKKNAFRGKPISIFSDLADLW
jgi:hypothetical protein